MARTEWEIFYTTGRVLCFGALWTIVVLSLALSHVERNLTLIGWASVIGASLIFSTTTIPYKTPSLQTAHIDPLLFSVFTGIGIFLVSLPIMVYLLGKHTYTHFLSFSISLSLRIMTALTPPSSLILFLTSHRAAAVLSLRRSRLSLHLHRRRLQL